jgi:hypothetical protein
MFAFFRKMINYIWFWWESRELEIRKLFINKMINITKPWYVKLYNLKNNGKKNVRLWRYTW